MAFVEPEGVNITQQYYVYERYKKPVIGDVYYTNVNYLSNLNIYGYNKFPARSPSATGGWVLPNCTGYSYGRILETCNLDHCDYVAGNAAQWFDYNKNLFDNNNGLKGYPYIQLKKNYEGYNLGSGFISDSSFNNLAKLILLLCRPGNVVCYGSGTSSLNGNMVFDEAGHVQTIERIVADDESFNNMMRDLQIGEWVIKAVAALFGIEIGVYSIAGYLETMGLFWDAMMTAFLYKDPDKYIALIKLLLARGSMTKDKAVYYLERYAYILGEYDLSKIRGAANASALSFFGKSLAYIGAILMTLGVTDSLTESVTNLLLDSITLTALPATVISHSSYNGYSSSSSIGIWSRDTIYFANALQTVAGDETLQGIILTPCQVPSTIARRNKHFPWQLGNSLGIY